MKNVAIFASGDGTNAENVIAELEKSDLARVTLVVTNNRNAGVIQRAEKCHVDSAVIDSKGQNAQEILEILKVNEIDIILLLGYLRLFPLEVIEAYKGHIANLHPALLPKYGGKGMYGHFVHEAVSASGDRLSGFTLQRSAPRYDEGEILYQEEVQLPAGVTSEECERLVRALEHEKVAPAIRELIESGVI